MPSSADAFADPSTDATVEVVRAGPWLSVGPVRAAEWVRVTLPLSTLPAGTRVRLAHLTDLHVKLRVEPVVEEVLAALAADPPDVVVLTGDLVDDKYDARPALPAVRSILSRLTSRHGVFGVLGNHDGDLMAARVTECGVRLIGGESVRVNVAVDGGAAVPLDLVGLPGVARDEPDADFERDRDPNVATVALSHYPDAINRLGRLRPDLVLAGHTHGGQICLPDGTPIITHDSLPRRMAKGLHRTDYGGWLFVSHGLGTAAYAVRLFCPAQVAEVVLTSTHATSATPNR